MIAADPIRYANQSDRRSAQADLGGLWKSLPSLPESAFDKVRREKLTDLNPADEVRCCRPCEKYPGKNPQNSVRSGLFP